MERFHKVLVSHLVVTVLYSMFLSYLANELRSWLFHYSVPVLFGILPPVYFVHYAMFVSAMVTLNGLSVTLRQLDRVKCQLDDFYRAYERLYGKALLDVFSLAVILTIALYLCLCRY